MIGIYGIYNNKTDKWYVGSSIDILKRWGQHTSELNRNVHCNSKLQRAYNKYGNDAFEYHILATYSSSEHLDHYEMLWTIALDAMKNGYVLKAGNRNPLYSKESRKKMSISAKKRGTPWWNGRKHSEESRQKISDKRKGFVISKETGSKISEATKGRNAWNKGKKHTEESRSKMSESNKIAWIKRKQNAKN